MSSTLDNNSGHQNERVNDKWPHVLAQGGCAVVTNKFLFKLKKISTVCSSSQCMVGRQEGTKSIICKEKSVEANVELRQRLDKIVRKLPSFGNRRTRSTCRSVQNKLFI